MNPLWRETAREAWRNITSGTTHAVRWALVLTVVISTLAWIDTRTVETQVDYAAAYLVQGGATWILQASGAVSGVACEALGQDDGVRAAGALRDDHTGLTSVVLPRAPIPAYLVTPGFLAVVSSTSLTGVIVSEQVASRYGLDAPDLLATNTGDVPIGGTYPYPDDGRRPGLGFAALEPTDANQVFDECWMTIWPSSEQTRTLLYTVVLSGSDQQSNLKLSQWNPGFASSLDAARAYETRQTKWASLVALLAGAVIGFTATWTRRLEHASNLHTGLPHTFLVLQTLQETLVWALIAAIISLPFVGWAAYPSPTDTSAVARTGLRAVLAGLIGPLFGAVLAIIAIREKYLFTLFKNR